MGFRTIDQWTQDLAGVLNAWLGTTNTFLASVSVTNGGSLSYYLRRFKFARAADYLMTAGTIQADSSCYWLMPGNFTLWSDGTILTTPALFSGAEVQGFTSMISELKPQMSVTPGWYINVEVIDGEGWADTGTLPAPAMGVISASGGKELIKWNSVNNLDDGTVALKLTGRGLGDLTSWAVGLVER